MQIWSKLYGIRKIAIHYKNQRGYLSWHLACQERKINWEGEEKETSNLLPLRMCRDATPAPFLVHSEKWTPPLFIMSRVMGTPFYSLAILTCFEMISKQWNIMICRVTKFWNDTMRPTNPTVIVTAEPLLAGIILYLGRCSEIKLIRNKTWSKITNIWPIYSGKL